MCAVCCTATNPHQLGRSRGCQPHKLGKEGVICGGAAIHSERVTAREDELAEHAPCLPGACVGQLCRAAVPDTLADGLFVAGCLSAWLNANTSCCKT